LPTLDAIREAGERDLQELLARLDARHRRILRDAIRRYGRVQNIPESVWEQIRSETESETVALLLLLMINADAWTAGEIKSQGGRIGGAGKGGTAGYALTAAGRATRMSLQTTQTLRDRLARSVEQARLNTADGKLGELTDEGLEKSLDDVFTKARRETISTNETTGSITSGQRGATGRVGQSVTVEMRWVTERDDRVCPRCSPLQDTPEEVWSLIFPEGPGEEAHPNCRCELRPVVVVEQPQEVAA
jgi:hypothetical protein